jgi:hypothetical protein
VVEALEHFYGLAVEQIAEKVTADPASARSNS